jgi:hypothetical protein
MTALTADTNKVELLQDSNEMVYPVAANTTLYKGAMVVIDPALGTAKPAASLIQGHLRVVGVACGKLPKGARSPVTGNSAVAVSAADCNVLVKFGRVTLINGTSTDALSAADVGMPCYAMDTATVSKDSLDGNRPLAGIFLGLHDDGRAIVQIDGHERFSGEVVTMKANADLSLLQYTQVRLADDTGAAEIASATDPAHFAIGILLNAPVAGDPAIVAIGGVAPCVVGASNITAGNNVAPTTGGKSIAAAATKTITGRALETGTADQVKMILIKPGQVAA